MMTFKNIFSTAAVAALLAAGPLVAQQDIHSDYDPSFHFNKIKSYSWAKIETPDPMVEPRLAAAVDKILQGEGWHQVDKNPSVVISAVEANGAQAYARFYRQLAGYNWRRGWGGDGLMDGAASPSHVPAGTLVVDMYDPSTKKLVWRATALEPTDAKEKTKQDDVDKTAKVVFGQFPWKVGGPVAANAVNVPDTSAGQTTTGNVP